MIHHPFGDVLLLRCQSCGFAIGADDLHDCVENWDRRARARTGPDEHGPDVRWKPGMSADERMDLIGCDAEWFAKIDQLPKERA